MSAYGGVAKLIQDANILEAAVRIALTEAYHAGNVRLIIALKEIPTQSLDANDYPPPPSGTKYFTTSRAGLAKIRTRVWFSRLSTDRARAALIAAGSFPRV